MGSSCRGIERSSRILSAVSALSDKRSSAVGPRRRSPRDRGHPAIQRSLTDHDGRTHRDSSQPVHLRVGNPWAGEGDGPPGVVLIGRAVDRHSAASGPVRQDARESREAEKVAAIWTGWIPRIQVSPDDEPPDSRGRLPADAHRETMPRRPIL